MTEEEKALAHVESVIDKKNKAFQDEVLTPLVAKSTEGLATKADFDAIKGMDATITELNGKVGTLAKKFEEQMVNAQNTYSDGTARMKSQEQIINEYVKELGGNSLSDIFSKNKKVEFDVQKSVQSMSSLGAGVILPRRTVQDIIQAPYPTFFPYQLTDRGLTTDSNTISYTKELSYTSNIAIVNEGDLFPEDNFTAGEIVDNVRKLGTTMTFTSEIMRNLPRLMGYAIPRMVNSLNLKKSQQVLKGTNSPSPTPQIRGLWMEAQTYAYSTALGGKVVLPNLLDLIVKAKLMATNLFHTPNVALVNDADWSDVLLNKTQYGEYVFKDNYLIAGSSIIEIITTPLMLPNECLVGAFNTAAELFTQVAPIVEFSEHVEFRRDSVVGRIKTEIVQQVSQPEAFVKIPNIATAITALTKA